VEKGLVVKVTGNVCNILTDENYLIEGRIKGKLRTKDFKATNPVTVGDIVEYERISEVEAARINDILPRKNYIIRKSVNLSKQYHIIAANVDQAVLVITLTQPEVSVEFIDRYLVAAEAYKIPVVLVFNKTDLLNPAQVQLLNELLTTYKSVGYQCLVVSALKKENIDELAKLLSGKISVLNGNSGVGKSSLVKAIFPGLNIKIGQISAYHETGMHTTSYAEMFCLPEKTFIIDTPGIRSFGLIDVGKEEIYHFFPEIFNVAKGCKFNNCTHTNEPACAVKEAVSRNEIALSRYSSYLNIFMGTDEKYRT
jgi:ribosome biogenesis GTPase